MSEYGIAYKSDRLRMFKLIRDASLFSLAGGFAQVATFSLQKHSTPQAWMLMGVVVLPLYLMARHMCKCTAWSKFHPTTHHYQNAFNIVRLINEAIIVVSLAFLLFASFTGVRVWAVHYVTLVAWFVGLAILAGLVIFNLLYQPVAGFRANRT